MDRTVVFTADDFGITEAANRAIASAHADGVLTSAGIMVCEGAAGHAAALAADLPLLGVGLHLTVSDGHAALSRTEAPLLVCPNGRFRRSPILAGLVYGFSKGVRPELRREIGGQFELCDRMGLGLDHADGHQHLHMHPVLWDMLVAECASRGVRWIRLPDEGRIGLSACPGPSMARRLEQAVFRVLSGRCRRVAEAHGVHVADRVVGHLHTGAMTESRILEALATAVPGITEIYSHPGASEAEHRALISHRVRETMEGLGIRAASFAEITARPEGRHHGADG